MRTNMIRRGCHATEWGKYMDSEKPGSPLTAPIIQKEEHLEIAKLVVKKMLAKGEFDSVEPCRRRLIGS